MRRMTAAIALSVSVLALSAGQAFADYTLNVIHINDLHSRIEAINRFDSTCSEKDAEEEKCFGGIARVHTKINELRDAVNADGGNVIVLDAGDQFQGSLYYATYKGKAASEFMNGIGFDAMAVGNHEFDDGTDKLAEFIGDAEFPVISGNTLVGANEAMLAGKIGELVVVERGGEKIGILSVLATDTDETSSPGDNVLFSNEVSYLKDAVTRLEGEGVNKIILLSHVGLPRDREIAAAVDGIDVIVGGHSHTLMSNTEEGAPPYPEMVKNPSGKDVPIVQAYAYSKYVGDLKVTFDDDGNVIEAVGDPIVLDASVTPNEAVAARVKELGAPIEDLKKKPVSEATANIDGDRASCRARECAMGNLVSDAMLERVKDQGIQVAIQNGGGLRASIDAGEITMGEVLTVLPFQNTLSTFQLKGSDIVAALENGVSKYDEIAGRFPQVAGLKYSFDVSKEPGGRISDVMVETDGTFAPIDAETVYGVVSNNFMRGGGDGYKVFATNGMKAYDFGPGLELVVAEYLTENRPYTPIENSGRITEKGAMMAKEGEEEMKKEEPAKTEDGSMAKSEDAMMAKEGEHIIVAGDNFWNLAKKYYDNPQMWQKIAEANPGAEARGLVIGTKLMVPPAN